MIFVLKGITLAILCSIVSLFTHFIVSFFRKGRLLKEDKPPLFELISQAKLLLLIWSILFLIYTALFFLPLNKINILLGVFGKKIEIIGFIYGIIFYLILSFIYLTIYYLIDRSVSATLLEIIEASVDKKLTLGDIEKTYNIERKYQAELEGMLEGGFIIKENDYYKNSFKGSLYAKVARWMKRFLKLGPGGY